MKQTYFIRSANAIFYFFVLALFFGPAVQSRLEAQQITPIRGTAGDLWADRILGEFNYSEIKPNDANANGLFNPTSSYVDRVNDRLYVVDSGNNRILGISHISRATTNGLTPDIILGQPNAVATGANGDSNWQSYNVGSAPYSYPNTLANSALILPSASSLMGEPYWNQSPLEGGAVENLQADAAGNLYVPDLYNNRVLRYDSDSMTQQPIGTAASDVWGQTDFTGCAYNNINGNNTTGSHPTASTFGFCGVPGGTPVQACGLGIDRWGNLWVADTLNNRVLRFKNSGGVGGHPSHTADVVFGQTDFVTGTYAGTYSATDKVHIAIPLAVRVDNAGNVYVLEDSPGNNYDRVSVFKPTTAANGNIAPQYRATGQAAFTTFDSYTPPSGVLTRFVDTRGLEIDPSTTTQSPTASVNNVGIWIEEIAGGSIPAVQGSINLQIHAAGAFSYRSPRFIAHGYTSRGSNGIATNGDIYVNNYQPDIPGSYRYPDPPAGTSNTSDIQPFVNENGGLPNKVDPVGFLAPQGVVIVKSSSVTQMVVGDINCLRYWNLPGGSPAGLTNGQPASGEAGTTTPFSIVKSHYSQMTTDDNGHLFVLHENQNLHYQGLVVVQIEEYNLPLTPLETPVATLTGSVPVLGKGVMVSWGPLDGIAVDANGSIWVSDVYASRALRIRQPFSNSPVVDAIIGQAETPFGQAIGAGCNHTGETFVGSTTFDCNNHNPTATSLNGGGYMKIDHHGDLFISDCFLESNGNWRMLRYSASKLPSDTITTCVFNIPADAVFGTQGSFTAYRIGEDDGNTAYWEPAFNSDDSYMVVGMNSQISGYPPVIIANPRQIIANPTAANNWDNNVVDHLKDFGPQSYSLTFDDKDNLYVDELNRNRVLIYLSPLANLKAPTPTSTPTNTPTNTPITTCSTLVTLYSGDGGDSTGLVNIPNASKPGNWITPFGPSNWIAPTAGGVYPPGDAPGDTFKDIRHFTIPPGTNLSLSTFDVNSAADDGVTVLVNGTVVGKCFSNATITCYAVADPITIPSNLFTIGVNTIEFDEKDQAGSFYGLDFLFTANLAGGCSTINTSTSTATSSATNTPTATGTNTATATVTNTATTTLTATITNSATTTPTATETNTATNSSTNTPVSGTGPCSFQIGDTTPFYGADTLGTADASTNFSGYLFNFINPGISSQMVIVNRIWVYNNGAATNGYAAIYNADASAHVLGSLLVSSVLTPCPPGWTAIPIPATTLNGYYFAGFMLQNGAGRWDTTLAYQGQAIGIGGTSFQAPPSTIATFSSFNNFAFSTYLDYCGNALAPTDTSTATATSTMTYTATNTLTATITNSATNTPTATETNTATNSSTNTPVSGTGPCSFQIGDTTPFYGADTLGTADASTNFSGYLFNFINPGISSQTVTVNRIWVYNNGTATNGYAAIYNADATAHVLGSLLVSSVLTPCPPGWTAIPIPATTLNGYYFAGFMLQNGAGRWDTTLAYQGQAIGIGGTSFQAPPSTIGTFSSFNNFAFSTYLDYCGNVPASTDTSTTTATSTMTYTATNTLTATITNSATTTPTTTETNTATNTVTNSLVANCSSSVTLYSGDGGDSTGLVNIPNSSKPGNWITPFGPSNWIAPTAGGVYPPGDAPGDTFKDVRTFTIPPGTNLFLSTFNVNSAADDGVTVLVNGTVVSKCFSDATITCYAVADPVTIPSNLFNIGTNTIEFDEKDQAGSFYGLDFLFTANLAGCPATSTASSTTTHTPTVTATDTPTNTATNTIVFSCNSAVTLYSGDGNDSTGLLNIPNSSKPGNWITPFGPSNWIAPTAGGVYPPGDVPGDTFKDIRHFTIPPGTNLSLSTFNVNSAADDGVTVLVNGTVASKCFSNATITCYAVADPVTIPGNLFNIGTNTIEFDEKDQAGSFYGLDFIFTANLVGCVSTSTVTNTVTRTMTNTVTATITNTMTNTVMNAAVTNSCAGLPEWSGAQVGYAVGARVVYGTVIYQCIQAHTSIVTWDPPAVPSLWEKIGACVGPTATPDCSKATAWSSNNVHYVVGQQVIYAGELYVCVETHNSNASWSPTLTLNVLWQDQGACSVFIASANVVLVEKGTSTITPTNTATSTVTPTPTEAISNGVSLPYPNPVVSGTGQVSFDYSVDGPSTLYWSVFTVASRKIYGDKSLVNASGTVTWNLRDKDNKPLSDGLYYLRVVIDGPRPYRKTFKVLVLR